LDDWLLFFGEWPPGSLKRWLAAFAAIAALLLFFTLIFSFV